MLTSHGRHRYEELDSLRGVAALAVVFYHSSSFWGPPFGPPFGAMFSRVLQSPLGLLFSGPDAVYVFFVMSGFVLFLPYIRLEGPDPYLQYVVKRVCRIYLPYLAAVALAVAADLLFYNPAVHWDGWVNWTRPFSLHQVVIHVALIWQPALAEFNPAFWSLIHEMRLSLIYPLIAALALRLRLGVGVAVSLVFCGLMFYAEGAAGPNVRTLGYGALFLLGALIARNLVLIRRVIEPRGAWGTVALLTLSVFFFKATHFLPAKYYQWWTLVPLHALGAALMMILALTSVVFRRLLHLRPVHWLGKVSYSFYLIHGTVLYSLASLFWLRTSHHFLLIVFGIALSMALAGVMYEWVERPAIALGRKLTRRDTPLAPAANLPA